MKPKILKDEEEYEAALDAISNRRINGVVPLFIVFDKNGPKFQLVFFWSIRLCIHQDPIEAIKFRMDQMGLKQKDLTEFIPAKSNVSELLSGKRRLSLPMIRALHENLGIPADVLVREVKLAPSLGRSQHLVD